MMLEEFVQGEKHSVLMWKMRMKSGDDDALTVDCFPHVIVIVLVFRKAPGEVHLENLGE
jgi:hypothetical protein